MRRKEKNIPEPPRVYDKYSGEYRAVPAHKVCGAQEGPESSAARRAGFRYRRRRRAQLVFYIFLFLFIVAGAAVLSLTVLFKTESIQVTGTSSYSQEQIIEASGIRKGENLFLVKTRRAQELISKKLPYVGSVQVSRKLPAQIVIHVGKAEVWGVLPYNGKYVVLGTGGKVLELADKLPSNCTVLSGLQIKEAKAGEQIQYKDASQESVLKSVVDTVKNDKLSKVTAMNFSSSYKILITYDGRIEINLGMPANLDYKIRFAKTLFDTGKIKSTEKGSLNLSVAADNDTAYFDPASGSVSSSSK
jgi:cell division protein FtsQ